MRLYRVLPFEPGAAPEDPGGVFFRPPGGKNRADSPAGEYRCLYVADTPSGAIAEAFGRFDLWDEALLAALPATPMLPGSRFALATFELADDAAIYNLDDARNLLDLDLRPSQVVTRDRVVTQQWASEVHARANYKGVGWWSYYDANRRSIALWDIGSLTVIDTPQLLHIGNTEVQRAATTIVRRLSRR